MDRERRPGLMSGATHEMKSPRPEWTLTRHYGEALVGDVGRDRVVRAAVEAGVVVGVRDPGEAGVYQLTDAGEHMPRVVEHRQAEAREEGHHRPGDLAAAG